VAEFDLVCEREWLVALAGSIIFVGDMVGASIFGWLADRNGRKPALGWALLVAFTSGLLAATSTSFSMYVVWRFMVGVGIGGSTVVSFVLLSENSSLKARTDTGPLFQLAFSTGVLLVSYVASVHQEWRDLTSWLCVPGGVLLVLWVWMMESPYVSFLPSWRSFRCPPLSCDILLPPSSLPGYRYPIRPSLP
jgi:MFS family permease